jgi:mRNA interferase MazF
MPKSVGHEQQGSRLGVVVQSDVMLPRSIVIVAPASTTARPASFRPEITVAKTHMRVLVEQTTAIDSNRLGKRVGKLDFDQMSQLDEVLRVVLGLD